MKLESIPNDYANEPINWAIACERLDLAAATEDEEKREDGLIYVLLDIATHLSHDFILKGGVPQDGWSKAKIKKKNNKFARYFETQNAFFVRCALRHTAYVINGKPQYPLAPESYASIICINAMMDHKLEAEAKGDVLDMENFSTYKMMKAAGYPVDIGLGKDLVDMLLDYGLMKIVTDDEGRTTI